MNNITERNGNNNGNNNGTGAGDIARVSTRTLAASLTTTTRSTAASFSDAFARSLEAASAPSRAMLEAKAKAESESDPESEAPQLAVVPEPEPRPRPYIVRVRGVRTGSPTSKAVLVTLGTYADPETGECWPSLNTLCADTQYSRSSVCRALTELERDGFIIRQRSTDGRGLAATTRYLLNLPQVFHPDTGGSPTVGRGVVPRWDGGQSHSDTGGSPTVGPEESVGRVIRKSQEEESSPRARARARERLPAPTPAPTPAPPPAPTPAKPSRELALAVIESWNQWARNEDRPTAQPTAKLTEKLMLRLGEGMTWDALAVELDRLSDFALGHDQWNGVTLHWIAQNSENWTKLAAGNYRRPAEKRTETIAQRRKSLMAPRKENTGEQPPKPPSVQNQTPGPDSGIVAATPNPLSFSQIVEALNLSPAQAARLRSHRPQ